MQLPPALQSQIFFPTWGMVMLEKKQQQQQKKTITLQKRQFVVQHRKFLATSAR